MPKAFIFDFDGVIVESESHWDAVQQELYARLIPGWKEEDLPSVKGMSVHDEHVYLAKHFGFGMELAEYRQEIEKSALVLYTQHAQLIAGIHDILERLREMGIPLAIATSSNRNWIEAALERFGLGSFFVVITTGEEVEGRGKPNPDIYLRTAEKLGIEPAQCVVMEDTANGVRAAKAAGMYAIGLSLPGSMQDLSSADRRIGSVDELTDEVLRELLA